MSSIPKSCKYIIWLENSDAYVEEGSGKPSLFDTERTAKRCAKELWPKTPWQIKKFTYIKQAAKRQEKAEQKYQLNVSSKVTAGGFQYKFKPPAASKPFCVFLFNGPKVRQAPDHSSRTESAARKWAQTAAKKFITEEYPDREVWILDCSIPDTPIWLDSISLSPIIDDDSVEDKARLIANTSPDSLPQPSPRPGDDGLWVCPITSKTYQTLSKYMFTNIIQAAKANPELYRPIQEWKAFTYGNGWICPYTGKIFKRIGKHLNNYLVKQRKLLKGP